VKGPALEALKFRTLNEVLAAAAEAPGELGLTFVDAREHDERLSWTEVQRRAKRVAGALIERGIRPGDRVAIVLPTAPSFVDAFFGALLAGAVPVPLYPPVRLGRIAEYHAATARMLTAAGACIVVSDRRVGLLLGESVQRARPALGLVFASTLLEEGSPVARDGFPTVAPDALGLIQFSSGSTTDPKPVALTHANLVAQCATLQQLMWDPDGPKPLGVSWLPLYHDMGLIGCLLVAAYWPGPLVLIPPEVFLARPAIWLRTISRFRGTISPAPNFAYGLCLKRVRDEDLDKVDLASWRFALNGAEPVSPEVIARFCERFGTRGFDPASLMPVYGLSEASLAVTFSPRRAPLRQAAIDPERLAKEGRVVAGARAIVSVGTPVPGVEVALRDEEGQAVADGRVGRVFARGPSVMSGYFASPEATARVLEGGWLDTGDVGFLEAGELYLCGRSKDLVIVRGANHAPQEFEECLDVVEGVRTGCAVALGFVPEGGSEELLILAEVAGSAPPVSAGPSTGRGRGEGAGFVDGTFRPASERGADPGRAGGAVSLDGALRPASGSGAPTGGAEGAGPGRGEGARCVDGTFRPASRGGAGPGRGEEASGLAESSTCGSGLSTATLEEQIRLAVLERTGIRPHTVRLLASGTLPRTSSGKLRRAEALRRFLANELTPPSQPTPLRMALEMAKSAVALARAKLDA